MSRVRRSTFSIGIFAGRRLEQEESKRRRQIEKSDAGGARRQKPWIGTFQAQILGQLKARQHRQQAGGGEEMTEIKNGDGKGKA